MAYRRRRRNRGTWLPLDPTILEEGGQGLTVFQTSTEIVNQVGGVSGTTLVPVAYDITRQTPEGINTVPGLTMRDITEGQDYFLDRIVGKVWCDIENVDPTAFFTKVLVCMAFAILPVEDDGTTVALDQDSLNPLFARNTMAPYIWRRTWILYGFAGTNEPFFTKPQCIAQYGSVMDGGHVDAKTKRRIHQNERLYFMFTQNTLEFVGAPTADDGSLTFGFDVRLHGALRRNRNTSTFR